MRSVLLKLVFCLVVSPFAFAEEAHNSTNGLVEKEQEINYDRPYRDRRSLWGFVFALQSESGALSEYSSTLTNMTYSQMFGGKFQTIELHLSAKLNTRLGSLSLGVGAGGGTVKDNRSGQDLALDLGKKSVSALFYLDTIFPEPYLVPYGGVVAVSWSANLKNSATNVISTSPVLVGSQVGALIQLNWMESSVARNAYASSGVESTYLDVFLAQYPGSTSENSPNLKFVSSWGAGLRVEY